MAPTRPLVVQQREACRTVMGMQQVGRRVGLFFLKKGLAPSWAGSQQAATDAEPGSQGSIPDAQAHASGSYLKGLPTQADAVELSAGQMASHPILGASASTPTPRSCILLNTM